MFHSTFHIFKYFDTTKFSKFMLKKNVHTDTTHTHTHTHTHILVPWFKLYVVDLSTRRLRFKSKARLCGICGRRMDTGTGFLQYLGFFLSLSFHRCSKLILSAVTDAVKSRTLTASLINTCTRIDTYDIGCGAVHLNADTDSSHHTEW